jgi:RNA polymerase sigma-70 factor (ECF subfamily)
MEPESSSFGLVKRAQAGDVRALDRLILRYLPRLRRWARRRLPAWARDVAETEDLVQETLFNAVRQLPTFQMRDEYALRSYMKRALRNRVQDEIKRATRHPPADALPEDLSSKAPSPSECTIARDDLWRCRVALARLRWADRRLILEALSDDMRLDTLAARTGKSSKEAARVALARALKRLAAEMERLAS